MMDSRRFRGSFQHDFCQCGRQQMFVSRNSPGQSWIRFGFLLIAVYLSRLKRCCERGVGAAKAQKIYLLKALKTLLPVIYGRYSGEVKPKLLVSFTCVSGQWSVSSCSVLDWWCYIHSYSFKTLIVVYSIFRFCNFTLLYYNVCYDFSDELCKYYFYGIGCSCCWLC